MQNGAIRVLVVGVGNMGLSHALAYDKIDGFEIVGLCSRSIRGRNDLPAELASLPRYENYRRGARRLPARCGLDQHLSQHPRGILSQGLRRGLPRLRREAARHHRGGCASGGGQGARHRQEAGHRLHPARAPCLDRVHRARADARQAAGHAHEPQSAEPGAGLELAPQSDGVADADRRLRGPLRGCHVPDDRRPAGARARRRRAAYRPDQGAELRPPACRVRRRLGGLVRGRLGSR